MLENQHIILQQIILGKISQQKNSQKVLNFPNDITQEIKYTY